MRIAVVGGGITGLGAAWALSRAHEVHLYEAGSRLGGHAHTVDVAWNGQPVAVDTGFIVYNDRTYPNLIRLFRTLDVPTAESNMSFSVSLGRGRFEYAGSPAGMIAQPANLMRPSYWRMVQDILRFYREAPAMLERPESELTTLGDYLRENRYSGSFIDNHLLPMGGAIWSSSTADVLRFPLATFVRFCVNHGLLSLRDRPQWRTVLGGSRAYVDRIASAVEGKVRLSEPVAGVQRAPDHVALRMRDGSVERFDHIVLATPADRSLAILGRDATPAERRHLGAFQYTRNRAVLHSDPALMPRRRAVWASWNYLGEDHRDRQRAVSVTYWMNSLQPIDRRIPLFVSLNSTRDPAAALTHGEFLYDHPQFDRAALKAQRSLATVQGARRTWFCGSYCGYGFHEDGLQAGLAVAGALGAPAPWADEIVPASPAADCVRAPAAVAAAA